MYSSFVIQMYGAEVAWALFMTVLLHSPDQRWTWPNCTGVYLFQLHTELGPVVKRFFLEQGSGALRYGLRTQVSVAVTNSGQVM